MGIVVSVAIPIFITYMINVLNPSAVDERMISGSEKATKVICKAIVCGTEEVGKVMLRNCSSNKPKR